MVYGCRQTSVKLYARVCPMAVQHHFRPRVLPELGPVHPSGVDIRLDEDNQRRYQCWMPRMLFARRLVVRR